MTTREQIIAAAKEAGFKAGYLGSHYSSTEALERFYTIAHEAGRQAERNDQMALLYANGLKVLVTVKPNP